MSIYTHFVYKTICPSGKYYYGRHSTVNINDGYQGSGKWVRSIKDKSILTTIIVEYANSFSELLVLEKKYLDMYIGTDNCMNFNDSSSGFATGELNWNRSEKAKQIKSERKKGLTFEQQFGIEKADAIKKKISSSHTGRKTGKSSWNHGLTPPEKVKEKISSSVKATYSAMSPEERKKKYGHTGEDNGFYNRHHSDETKNRIGAKRSEFAKNKITCPHCGKTIEPVNYKKYHGDNCLKPKGNAGRKWYHSDTTATLLHPNDPKIIALGLTAGKKIQTQK